MSKFIQTPAYADSMPVDISFVFEDEKPAGKHGFIKTDGDRFRFEDGSLARFWGVNFNGGANFPEHDYAEKVARRLAQTGCNIVRFHQLDAEWDTPNIYAYSKGKRVKTSRELDPISMDHLDYLIYCLKREGIYVYFDMMTYRKFKSGDDVPFAYELTDSAKPFSITNRRLIELQKEFCDQIWNHYNPYTELLYKDDPVFVMTEITNECDLFECGGYLYGGSPYYINEMRQMLKAWLEEKGIEYDWENCDLAAHVHPLIDWKMDVTRAYYKEMRDYLISLGVKIPITGTNWVHDSTANVVAQQDMDFVDSHHYFYDWRWGEDEKLCANEQINGKKSALTEIGLMRVNNRPYFISEWDMPWPNAFRAEGPIYYAAMSALQDWTGMAIHTYAYSTKLDKMDILGKEVSSATIGGVPYREGIFSVWNDPAKFGLFYHSALIVRRCDITPAKKKVGVTIPTLEKVVDTAFHGGMEQYRMATVIDGEEAVGCDEVISAADEVAWANPDVVISDNGQMWRNIPKKFGGIDTPRTKVLYGSFTLGRGFDGILTGSGTEVNGMKVDATTDFGVVALSSLTDDPIEKSDNLLLTTIGRARNTGAQFDGDKMVEFGTAPILSEVIQATISIRTEQEHLQVWGVNAEGFYVGRIPTTYADGFLTFTVGEKLPASYYVLVNE